MQKRWKRFFFICILNEPDKKAVMHFTDMQMEGLLQLPHHPGRSPARPLIRKILNDIELTVDEYNRILKDKIV